MRWWRPRSSEIAAAQGRFWPMHAALFEHQPHFAPKQLHRYAEELGLDMARYEAELEDHIYLQRVREHEQGGRASGVRASPGFFVNGRVQDVSFGMQHLHDAVAALLARVLSIAAVPQSRTMQIRSPS